MSLREKLVKLGAEHPELRSHIRPLLKRADYRTDLSSFKNRLPALLKRGEEDLRWLLSSLGAKEYHDLVEASASFRNFLRGLSLQIREAEGALDDVDEEIEKLNR